jgi:hypothetical protein
MKSTAELVDEYLAKYPPESFYATELAGIARPKLIPFDQDPPAQYEPRGAQMTAITLSRQDFEEAELELSARTGVPAGLIHDATLQLATGDDSGNTDFASDTDRANALSTVAAMLGAGPTATMPAAGAEQIAELTGGYDRYDGLELANGMDDVASEIARLAGVAPTRQSIGRDGQVREQVMIDPYKASQGLLPLTAARPVVPEVPMSDHQWGEVLRLTAVREGGLRKASYGAAELASTGEEIEAVGLSGGAYDECIVELAESGATTYTSNGGSVQVHEADVTDEGESWAGDEIGRLVGEAISDGIMSDPGNRSYSPAAALDVSNWGQRVKGPWSSVYGQG